MKNLVMSVDFEEWFHSRWFDPQEVISRYFNCKTPATDLEATTRSLLDLFDDYSVKTTFFCLVETCKRYPNALKAIVNGGHEIAFHGIDHECMNARGQSNAQFKKRLSDGRTSLEEISGSKIVGYRSPNFYMPPEGFSALSASGFLYDSSVVPCIQIPGWYGSITAPTDPHRIYTGRSYIVEFPITVFPFLRIPGSGGWFLRNFGVRWVKSLLKLHLKRNDLAVFYMHPWEVSNENPRLPEIPYHVFRRTGKWALENLRCIMDAFENVAHFTCFNEYLNDNAHFAGGQNTNGP